MAKTPAPPTTAAPTTKLRLVSSGAVARLRRTFMCYSCPSFPFKSETSVQRPAHQCIEPALRQRPKIVRDQSAAFGGPQQGPYRAVQFLFQRCAKLLHPIAEPCQPHRGDALAPGILIIRG